MPRIVARLGMLMIYLKEISIELGRHRIEGKMRMVGILFLKHKLKEHQVDSLHDK